MMQGTRLICMECGREHIKKGNIEMHGTLAKRKEVGLLGPKWKHIKCPKCNSKYQVIK